MDRATFCRTPEHVRLFYIDTGFDPLEACAMAENWSHIERRVRDKYGHKFKCVECGVESTFNTAIGCHHGVMMAAENICFHCAFWTLYIRMPHPERAIVNGRHYVCYPMKRGELKQTSQFRGCGGEFFVVAYFDGRVVWTQNRWHQGEIPARFLYALPDNACFIGQTKTTLTRQ